MQALLLGDPAGEDATGHEHVLVGTVDQLERLAVLLGVVRVERTLELQTCAVRSSARAAFGRPIAFAKNPACTWM